MTAASRLRISTRLGCCLVVMLGARTLAADVRPLSGAAKTLASQLPRGVIVTAEKTSGTVSYAAAGTLEPAGTPSERVIFEIGSITKIFTGLLLAQAVIEKKITLDTTLHEVLGREQSFADPRVGAISLKQLATHTSGLPRLPDDLATGANPDDPYAHYDRARLNAWLAKAKIEGDPPFEQSYSNLGMGLAGDVLARVYGKPWSDLVVDKITRPLGMKDTAVALSEEQSTRFAPAYNGEKAAKPWKLSVLAGAGALRSTAADMIIFGEALLHPDQTPLKEAFALMTQPQTPDGGIGLALNISKFDGRRVLEHNGGTGGYRSLFQVVPETGAIRVVLTNNAQLPGEKVLANARGEKPRTEESGKILGREQLAGYEGIYGLGEHARFTVLLRNDSLWTQLTGQAFFKMFPHEQDDRFFLKVVPAEIQFTRENGSVTSLALFQNGRAQKAKKTADPVPQIKFRSEQELAAYAGTYELLPKMVFTLNVRNNALFAQLTGQPPAPVFEKRDDWFEYDVVKAALEFERDPSRKIIALKLHQNSLVQRAVKK